MQGTLLCTHLCIAICEAFVDDLKSMNPDLPSMTYSVNDIFNYIDSMTEFNMLVYTMYFLYEL